MLGWVWLCRSPPVSTLCGKSPTPLRASTPATMQTGATTWFPQFAGPWLLLALRALMS